MTNGPLQAYIDDAIRLLCQIVAIPSVSRDEAAVADAIERYLTAIAATPVHRHGNNIWLVHDGFDATVPTLLLNAHIDTVKPVASWVRDPFNPTVEGDRIYGLGTNDDGASLVSLMHVFLYLQRLPLPYNLVFLASAEEEVSGKDGIQSVLPLLPHIDVALVGEPTGMNPTVAGGVRVAVAEKGLMVLDGVAHGKSGHAARNEGVNALYLALDAIDRLRNHVFDRQSAMLGPVKVTTTVINAGTVHNVIPDTCTFVTDVRTTDAYTNQEVAQILSQLVAPVELTPRSTRLQPSGIDLQHPLVQRILSVVPDAVLFGSPTLSDQALLPCPSLKMGPGDSARSHTADEYICRQEIADAICLYVSILDKLTITTS
ncbi:MAG: M20/M25/M40 family metallo-hydrolase [Bacteroidales bacterium]|nr:M20/M25/M40 family metallo-hydrolase [Candidatus Liminaster caballi]